MRLVTEQKLVETVNVYPYYRLLAIKKKKKSSQNMHADGNHTASGQWLVVCLSLGSQQRNVAGEQSSVRSLDVVLSLLRFGASQRGF